MVALEYLENVDVAIWSTLRTSMCRTGGEKGIATDNLNSRSLIYRLLVYLCLVFLYPVDASCGLHRTQ